MDFDARICGTDGVSFVSPEMPALGPAATFRIRLSSATHMPARVEIETRDLSEPVWRHRGEERTYGESYVEVSADGLGDVCRIRFTFAPMCRDGTARVALLEPLWLPESRSTP